MYKRWLLLCIICSVVIRFGAALYIGEEYLGQTDAGAYVSIAENILAGNGFVTRGGFHYCWYAPLYSITLLPFFGMAPYPFLMVRLLQAALVALMALGVARIALTLTGSPRASLLAAALTAWDPFLIYFSLMLLTETLFAFFSVALLWWLVVRKKSAAGAGGALMTGLLIGLAALTRPVILAYVPLVAIGWLRYQAGSVPVKCKRLALLGIGIIVLLLPWVIRNYLLFEKFVPVTLQSGMALYAGNYYADGIEPTGGGVAGIDYLPPAVPGWSAMNELEQSETVARLAKQYIRENPGTFLRMIPVKWGRVWSLVPAASSGHTQWYYAAVSLGSYGVMLPFFLAGLWLTRTRWRDAWPLYGYILFMLAFIAVYYGTIRFRVPMIPLITLWAGIGMDGLIEKYKIKNRT